jgi:Ser/Thr protein kinase RdoA (MazF antagonist)
VYLSHYPVTALLQEAEVLLLKGSADKPCAELAVQVELLRHLEAAGFPTAAAVPPKDSAAPWVIDVPADEGAQEGGGSGRTLAVFLLRFVGGSPANMMLGSGAVGAADVLATAGSTLARLHLIAPPAGFRRYGYSTQSLCCALISLLGALQSHCTHCTHCTGVSSSCGSSFALG